MLKKLETKIEEIARGVALSRGIILLDLEYIPRKTNSVIRLFLLHQARQINLSDCEQISKEVEMILDEEDIIPGTYTLEVSSPGLFRKIKHHQEYSLFINYRAKICYKDVSGNPCEAIGIIYRTGESSLTLDLGEKGLLSVEYKMITQANLAPEI